MSVTGNIFKAAAPALLLALAGCQTALQTQVSRFNELPAIQGQRFAIQPIDPRNEGGIEFGRYAALVRDQLTAKGMVEAPSAQAADLVVELDYGVDKGRIRYAQHLAPPYGPYDYYFGWYDPFYGDDDLYSYVVFTSYLDLAIKRASDRQTLFEGTAQARSMTDELPKLVPTLITAMFTNFPGRSGETVRITIPAPPRTTPRR
jgi:hypothetical protein